MYEPLNYHSGFPDDIIDKNLLEKRAYVKNNLDQLRKAILEPRGHADMYGALITEPDTPKADFGVIFIHNRKGYSTLDVVTVIALTKMFVETGN